MKMTEGGVCAPQGFMAAGLYCGLRKNKTKKDLALIYSKTRCAAAAVYTQNKVQGAPIALCRQHLADDMASAVICNSGNANTCNADGLDKAHRMAIAAARALGIDKADVLVASTGVIGQPLNVEAIEAAAPALASALSIEGATDAAEAIMTTDTVKKEFAVELLIDGKRVVIGSMAKGSGMIHPNMATLLGFITTDAAISPPMLKKALSHVIERTYNCISIDGDTSTNDTVIIMANGQAGNREITCDGGDYQAFVAGLNEICVKMARAIARDGEGATHLLECTVKGADSFDTAKALAKSVIMSSLVKSAFFGADANWGRILCALGYCDAPLDTDSVDVDLRSNKGVIPVCRKGAGVPFSEEKAKEILLEHEINIDITVGNGSGMATAWGCDLTYDYVKINGDYRT